MSTESSSSKSNTITRSTRSNTRAVSNTLLTLVNPITTIPTPTPPKGRTKTTASRKRTLIVKSSAK
ncbi:hypothetical protein A2U01_0090164, partial [Trifolium medium]|nr:hypothetical protein [Trifolium medium]